MKAVSKVLKTALLIIMGFAAALLAVAAVPSIFCMPRVSESLLVITIGVTSAATLWIELKAFGKWIAAHKAGKKHEKVLSVKSALILALLLMIYEVAVAVLFGVVLLLDGKMLAFMLLLPTLETPFAIPLWLAVVVFAKQLIAKLRSKN